MAIQVLRRGFQTGRQTRGNVGPDDSPSARPQDRLRALPSRPRALAANAAIAPLLCLPGPWRAWLTMLSPFVELSKLHIGACITLWRIWHPWRGHGRGNAVFYYRAVVGTRLGAHLAAAIPLGVGMA